MKSASLQTFRFFGACMLFLSIVFVSGCRPHPAPSTNVLLITLDTTRYDVIQPHITPNIHSVRAESFWFSACTAPSPITLPTHASLFTGLYPNHHGVRDNTIYRLDDRALTLAEILRRHGYHTAAFVSSFILDSRFGLDQGFLRYNDRFLRPKKRWRSLPVDRRAEETIQLSLQFFKNNLQEPFFLWIHLYDPHADYDPPPPFDRLAPDQPYIGEVAYMDHQLGRLISFLRDSRIWYRTITVIAADHGESLGSHGEPTHGFLLHEPTLHVPLMIHLPRQTRGVVREEQVSLVDVFPTVLDLLKIPSGPSDGRNLMDPKSRPVYSETFIPLAFHWSPLFRVRSKNLAYVALPHDALYDLASDGGESRPARGSSSRLKNHLRLYQNEKPLWLSRTKLDQETIDRLISLGYFMAGGEPEIPEWNGFPDPWTRMHVFRMYQETISLMEDERLSHARTSVSRILQEEPNNSRFLLLAAEIEDRDSRPKQAYQLALKALDANPGDARNHFLAGFYAEKMKRMQEAEIHYLEALNQNPNHLLARYNFSRLLIMKEEYDRAEKILLDLCEEVPHMASVWNNLGYLYMARDKNCDRSLKSIRHAVTLAPGNELFSFSLASTLLRCGKKEEAERHFSRLEEKKIPPELMEKLRGEKTRLE